MWMRWPRHGRLNPRPAQDAHATAESDGLNGRERQPSRRYISPCSSTGNSLLVILPTFPLMNLLRTSAIAVAFTTLSASATLAQSAKQYGKALTLKEKTPISSILKDPKAYNGKRVQVEGTIVEVCETRGCWIRISSDKEFEAIRFKVEDGVITFPMDARGKTVLAEGVVSVKTLTREQVIEQARMEAKERGTLAQFDPSKIKSGATDIELTGEGARVR
jgi:hypothetical protein